MYAVMAFLEGILLGLGIGVLVFRAARRREADGDLFVIRFGSEQPTLSLSLDKDVSEIIDKDTVIFNVHSKSVAPKSE